MIKKLIFAVSCCFFNLTTPRVVCHPDAYTMRAAVAKNFAALPAEQIQLIANLLFFSKEFSKIDAQVRDLAQEITFDFYNLKKNTLEYNNITTAMAKCEQKLAALKTRVEKQQALYACWKACTLHVDSIQDEPFTLALNELQNAMQKETIHLCLQGGCCSLGGLDPYLQQGKESLLKCHEQTGHYAHLFGTLAMPEKSTSDSHDEYIQKISLASNICTQTEKTIEDVLIACNNIHSYENGLQKNTHRILADYYNEIRTLLNKLDPSYSTIIFDKDGSIIPEKRCHFLPLHS